MGSARRRRGRPLRPRGAVLCAWGLLLLLPSPGGAESPGAELAAALGCGACHADLVAPSALREQIPDLGGAGLRYRPEYLFDYLQAPTPRRRHLGPARMPDFQLHEAEAVALALFLAEQRREPPGGLPEAARPEAMGKEDGQAGEPLGPLLEAHSCLACHAHGGRGGRLGPSLDDAGARLQPDWIRHFLVAPDRFGVPDGRMPALFLRPRGGGEEGEEAGRETREEAEGAAWQETVPGAGADLVRIASGLAQAGAARQRELASAWQAARARHPGASAAIGRRIFVALNCAGCHAHPEIAPWRDRAPSLAAAGARVRRDWLERYLFAPEPLRALGTPPGSGSRMPDFQLDDAEAVALAAFLAARRGPPGLLETSEASEAPLEAPSGGPSEASSEGAPGTAAALSAFALDKARRLLSEKLPCLGCHRLGEEGGRIGPDLASAGQRLQPAFAAAVVRAPRQVLPHSAMPEVPMSPRERDLVVRYLQQNREPRRPIAYGSLVERPPLEFPAAPEGRALYARLCAACHGAAGGGDGPNAPYLPARPTAHADAAHLSSRPDDVLFDGIAAGGAILGKSHRMPAWDRTLTRQQIDALVGELRALCRCTGPAWSEAAGDSSDAGS